MPEAEEVVVLVVDDHAPIRELVRAVLEGAGYAVREAADGARRRWPWPAGRPRR